MTMLDNVPLGLRRAKRQPDPYWTPRKIATVIGMVVFSVLAVVLAI